VLLLQARKAAREGAAGASALADAGKSEGIGLGASLLVASVAGCINVLLTNPIWVVITQMQAMQRHEAALARGASTWSVSKTIFRDHGIGGFFKVRARVGRYWSGKKTEATSTYSIKSLICGKVCYSKGLFVGI
jgi:adenine nucleotide transporter 17